MKYGTKRAVRNALVVWGLFAVVGCDTSSSNERILPDSNGSPGELLVVADDSVWFGGTGLVVAETLGGPMDGLPQSEPKYIPGQRVLGRLHEAHHCFQGLFVLVHGGFHMDQEVGFVRDNLDPPLRERILQVLDPSS